MIINRWTIHDEIEEQRKLEKTSRLVAEQTKVVDAQTQVVKEQTKRINRILGTSKKRFPKKVL